MTDAAYQKADQDTQQAAEYEVVINDEEQHSIWPVDRENPLGWHSIGVSGTRERCLEHIREVWTDIRPLSVRRRLQECERERRKQEEQQSPDENAGAR